MQEKAARIMAVLGATLGAAAVMLQFGLMLDRFHGHGGTAFEALWRFLGFFTNVSNVFAALVLAHAALRPKARTRLASPRIEAAATLAVLMAGILNSALLAGRFHPQGLFWLTDVALHEGAPLAACLFWLLRPHGGLNVRDAVLTLAWPLAYCVYALTRGAFDGWYPYYFLDPTLLGAVGLAGNILALGVAFLGAAFLLLSLDRMLARIPRKALAEKTLLGSAATEGGI
jgi:hypothetical protein